MWFASSTSQSLLERGGFPLFLETRTVHPSCCGSASPFSLPFPVSVPALCHRRSGGTSGDVSVLDKAPIGRYSIRIWHVLPPFSSFLPYARLGSSMCQVPRGTILKHQASQSGLFAAPNCLVPWKEARSLASVKSRPQRTCQVAGGI